MPMENCPLATDSFSYSWLTNRKPSVDGLDEEPLRPSPDSSNEATKDMKYEIVKSRRFFEEDQNFNFDTPVFKSPVTLVHADEIFSDGHIMPVYDNRSKIEAFNTSNSDTAIPLSSLSCRAVCPVDRIHCHFLRKWRKSSKRIFMKCFGFLRPWCLGVGCSRKSIRVDDIDGKVLEVHSWGNSLHESPQTQRSTACDWSHTKHISNKVDRYWRLKKTKRWNNSPQSSPPRNPSYSADGWCDTERSIYEAVLHCKRSIEEKEMAEEESDAEP
ncbi:unnamed protein product [Ilex paraguariensis]|uniref:Membrane-associated kinase regulator 6 n=1 Tax=Ilex paraguariensis TaxID=185542 RepID=A0ABC8QNT7_9AQUA